MQKAIIIIGPTSSGKTSLAFKIAKKINGAIISADSRQVYKYMNIGTGKAPVNTLADIKKGKDKWQVDGVDVYMYDLVLPNEDFSVSTYVEKAKIVIEKIVQNNQIPIIVGGTGFYIEILTSQQNIFPVAPDQDLRNQLENLTLEQLQKTLSDLDKEKFDQVDIKNPVRLIRAIEIAKSGKSEVSIGLENFDYLKIGLSTDRELLFQQVDIWTEAIIRNGFIEEVKDLVERGYIQAQPMQGMLYKTVVAYLKGEIILKEDLIEKLKFELHNYIRRQQTYFKKIKDINWYDIKDNTFDLLVLKQVELFYNAKNPE